MGLNQDARQYAELLFAESVRDITRRREEKLKQLDNLPRGGGRDAAIATAYIECIEALGKAYVDSYLRAYERSSTPFTRKEANELADQAQKLIEGWFAGARSSPGMPPLFSRNPRDARSIGGELRQSLLKTAIEAKLDLRQAPAGERKDLIFISCGQFSEQEKALGNEIKAFIEEHTSLKPYFADNQSTFQGLTTHILDALNNCVGFIGIMHHRGTVDIPSGKITRASVWIEQGIAIASFIEHVLGRHIAVQLYIQKGICREGMRDKLLLNPIEFAENQEVVDHLKKSVGIWRSLHPATMDPAIQVSVDYEKTRISGERHVYLLVVTLTNRGAVPLQQYWVDVQFPSAYLDTSTTYIAEVPERRTEIHRFFRTSQDQHRKVIFPGDSLRVFTIDYFVDRTLFWKGLKGDVTVEAHVPGLPPKKIVKPITELQIF